MGSMWNPKPLRPAAVNPLFRMEEGEVVVKGLNPMQRQRLADGSPYTTTSTTALRPADPELILRADLVKSSMVEKFDQRPEVPKQDPEDPISVVKSYMAWNPDAKEQAESVQKSTTAVLRMQLAINELLRKSGTCAPPIPTEDDEDENEEKALGGTAPVAKAPKAAKPAASPKPKAGPGLGSVIGGAVRTVMAPVRK